MDKEGWVSNLDLAMLFRAYLIISGRREGTEHRGSKSAWSRNTVSSCNWSYSLNPKP